MNLTCKLIVFEKAGNKFIFSMIWHREEYLFLKCHTCLFKCECITVIDENGGKWAVVTDWGNVMKSKENVVNILYFFQNNVPLYKIV